jgi:nicotinamidase-related amidase
MPQAIGLPHGAANALNHALLVIDMQLGFDAPRWGRRNNPDAETNGLHLLALWRRQKRPVVCVRHDSTEADSPLRPGTPGHRFKPGFEPGPGDWLIAKRVNSAFIATGLEARLRAQGIRRLTVFGLTTDHCVSTSVRMAANLGFDVTLVEDACACFAKRGPDGQWIDADALQRAHVASLAGEFASVTATQVLLTLT